MKEINIETYCEEEIKTDFTKPYKNCNLEKELFLKDTKILNKKIERILKEMKSMNSYFIRNGYSELEVFDVGSIEEVLNEKDKIASVLCFEYVESVFEAFKDILYLKNINQDDLISYYISHKYKNLWNFVKELKNSNLLLNDEFNENILKKYEKIQNELDSKKNIFNYDISLINYHNNISLKRVQTSVLNNNTAVMDYTKENNDNNSHISNGLSLFRKEIILDKSHSEYKKSYSFLINENCYLKNYSILITNPVQGYNGFDLNDDKLKNYVNSLNINNAYNIKNENDFMQYVNDDDNIVYYIGIANDLSPEDNFLEDFFFNEKTNLVYYINECDYTNPCNFYKTDFCVTYKKYGFNNKKHISSKLIYSSDKYNYYLYQEIIIVNSPLYSDKIINQSCPCSNSNRFQPYNEYYSLLISYNGLDLLLTNGTIILPHKIKIIKKEKKSNIKPNKFKLMRNNFFNNYYDYEKLKIDLLNTKSINSIIEFFLYQNISKNSSIEEQLLNRILEQKNLFLTENNISVVIDNLIEIYQTFSNNVPVELISEVLYSNALPPNDKVKVYSISTAYYPASIIIGENEHK